MEKLSTRCPPYFRPKYQKRKYLITQNRIIKCGTLNLEKGMSASTYTSQFSLCRVQIFNYVFCPSDFLISRKRNTFLKIWAGTRSFVYYKRREKQLILVPMRNADVIRPPSEFTRSICSHKRLEMNRYQHRMSIQQLTTATKCQIVRFHPSRYNKIVI